MGLDYDTDKEDLGEPDPDAFFDLKSFLLAEDLDYLIRNNDDQVSVDHLDGKIIGLYFAFHPSHSCHRDSAWMTAELIKVYNELPSKGDRFEIVFVAHNGYELSECYDVPWLAIPSTEFEIREGLRSRFKTHESLRMILLDETGKVFSFRGVEAVLNYGSMAYPFTAERLVQLQETEPPLRCLLGTDSRDYLILNNGSKVPISELEGSTIGLYFADEELGSSIPLLKEMYEERKARGEKFEIVFVPLAEEGASIELAFKEMPWPAIPMNDKICRRLEWQFSGWIDNLMIIDSNAQPLNGIALDVMEDFGTASYPFLLEKGDVLGEKIKEMTIASQTLESLLGTEERDYLIRKCGEQVKISDLKGKIVILFRTWIWGLERCLKADILFEIYHELFSKGEDLEVIFVSSDINELYFNKSFSKMPWLAIPYSDSVTRDNLINIFRELVTDLVVIDRDGKFHYGDVGNALVDYGLKAYPFTTERINQLRAEEFPKRDDMTFYSVLVSINQGTLISNQGNKVHVSELEEKILLLYFTEHYWDSNDFTKLLVDVYWKLKEREEKFEIVLVHKNEESASKLGFADVPWLAIPFEDRCSKRLFHHFKIMSGDHLVVIGSNGKVLNFWANELIEKYGDKAYPYSPEKMEVLLHKNMLGMELELGRPISKLDSLLVSWQRDYVIGKDGIKIPVSELVGKTVLLCFATAYGFYYFKQLVEAYNMLKKNDSAFEVIFVSCDDDIEGFTNIYSRMPWLALPFGDERIKSLRQEFDHRYPDVVAIPPGHAITKGLRLQQLIMLYGADGYPFTKQQLRQLEVRRREFEAQMEQVARAWPEKVRHGLHKKHELVRMHEWWFHCAKCNEADLGWCFSCNDCNFYLHPSCALEDGEEVADEVPRKKHRSKSKQ